MIKSEQEALQAIRDYLASESDDRKSRDRLDEALRYRAIEAQRLQMRVAQQERAIGTLLKIKRDRLLDFAQVSQAFERIISQK